MKPNNTKVNTQEITRTPTHNKSVKPDESGRKKPMVAGLLGTIVEYYDFGIYGYMATFISLLFFASDDSTIALLNTFATFAVAFFLRIPGGLLFGHIGDKYGRKTALTWTILLMCIATAGIGIVPTYFTLGLWATLLLVLLRCVQGIAAGGELGGATTFAAEYAPKENRGFQVAVVNTGSIAGGLVASIIALIVTTVFSEELILEWAWRIPFLLSVPLAIVGLWVRASLEDTPEYKKLKVENDRPKLPISVIISSHKKDVGIIAGLATFITGGYYIASVYAATYLQTEGGLSSQTAFWSTSVALVTGIIVSLIAGKLSDRLGRKPMFLLGAGSAVIFAFPLFILMSSGSVLLAIIGHVGLFSTVAITMAPAFATFTEILTARVRYSGVSLGFNCAQTLVGGTAPFISTWLIQATQSNLAPAGYFTFCASITVITALFIRETRGSELKTH